MSKAYVVCRCVSRYDIYEIPERVYLSKDEAEKFAVDESARLKEQYNKDVAAWYEWADQPMRNDDDEPHYPYTNEWYVVHEVEDFR